MNLDLPKPIWDHLEDLRWCIVKSLAALAVGTGICYPFSEKILWWVVRPVGHLIYIEPVEAFMVRLKVSAYAGFLIAFPVIVYQLWRFFGFALKKLERKYFLYLIPSSYVLFLIGIAFGLFIVIPPAMQFFLSYSTNYMQPAITVGSYFSFVSMVALAMGAIYQMPLVLFLLGKLGLVTAEWLRSKRRIFILVNYIFCAWITPGPDPVSAILLALSSMALYELSIFLIR